MTTLIPKFDLKNGGSTPAGAINRTIYEKLSDSISVKDFGAVGDGIADDTAAIQAAATAAIGKQIFFPSGTYKVTATVTFNSSIIGENSTINFVYSGARASPVKLTGNNHVVSGLIINCNNTDVTNAIWLYDATGTIITGNTISNARVMISIGSNVIDTTITNNQIYGGGYGILYDELPLPANYGDSGSSKLLVSNNQFHGAVAVVGAIDGGDAIELNAPVNGFSDFQIINNSFYNAFANAPGTAGFCVGVAGGYNGVISNNYMYNSTYESIHIEEGNCTGTDFTYSYNITISNNTIINSGSHAIIASYSQVVITNNNIYGPEFSGVFLYAYTTRGSLGVLPLKTCVVSGNTISNSGESGIYCVYANFLDVSNNKIVNSGLSTNNTYYSINLDACEQAKCANNYLVLGTSGNIEKGCLLSNNSLLLLNTATTSGTSPFNFVNQSTAQYTKNGSGTSPAIAITFASDASENIISIVEIVMSGIAQNGTSPQVITAKYFVTHSTSVTAATAFGTNDSSGTPSITATTSGLIVTFTGTLTSGYTNVITATVTQPNIYDVNKGGVINMA
jgi:hypothetical protein